MQTLILPTSEKLPHCGYTYKMQNTCTVHTVCTKAYRPIGRPGLGPINILIWLVVLPTLSFSILSKR